ncbi:uncharacterized protein LOC127286731 isoform X2 [Leptopilina boulardi]|uniref:uncharacterized protein LOC127286731 isoform X2 n=1 Tax=Leptopilina boulardi TaxID=63433 RepID=UPI0021F53EA0|nr:uncharacterized protein LOC127286731 isoform X2 [Leptopilina boulardi]
MDIVKKPYYNITRYVIIFTGLSRNYPTWFNFLTKLFIFFVLFSFMGVQIAGMIKYLSNIDLVLVCIPPICYSSMGTILYINNNLQVKQINVVFWKMQNDWDTITSEKEVNILHKYARKSRTYTILYTFGFLGMLMLYYSSHGIPMIIHILKKSDGPKPLLFLIECGLDLQENYGWVIFYSYLTCYVCTYGIVIGGTILGTFLEHACGIFEIIGYKLTIAINENPFSSNVVNSQKKFQQEVKLCVEMHRRVLLFMDDIQAVFSTPYLFVFGLSVILLSITGVQFVMSEKSSGDGIRYNADWYHLSSESTKLLLIIMRKGSEPTTFIVGKIFILSLQFFRRVIQTSMSYFTVLNSVRG